MYSNSFVNRHKDLTRPSNETTSFGTQNQQSLPTSFLHGLHHSLGNKAVMQMFRNQTVSSISSSPGQIVQRVIDETELRKELEKRDLGGFNSIDDAISYFSEMEEFQTGEKVDDIIPTLESFGIVLKSEVETPLPLPPKKKKEKKQKQLDNATKNTDELAPIPQTNKGPAPLSASQPKGLSFGNSWSGKSDKVTSDKGVSELNASTSPKDSQVANDVINKFKEFKAGERKHGGCKAFDATPEDLEKIEQYAIQTKKWNVIWGPGDGAYSKYMQLKLVHVSMKSNDNEQNVTYHISYKEI